VTWLLSTFASRLIFDLLHLSGLKNRKYNYIRWVMNMETLVKLSQLCNLLWWFCWCQILAVLSDDTGSVGRLCWTAISFVQVFPDLRAWCEARRLYLVDVDLRWVWSTYSSPDSYGHFRGMTVLWKLQDVDVKCASVGDLLIFLLNLLVFRFACPE